MNLGEASPLSGVLSCYTNKMKFLTIHELSVEFDVPARVLRYRFLQLVQGGKLVENQDYRRDDFVDAQHFTWLINPVSFARETGYQVVNKPKGVVTKTGNQENAVVTKQGNEIENLGAKPVNQTEQHGNEKNAFDNSRGNQVGNKSGEESKAPPVAPTPSLEREMIDLLKGQIVVKDAQIKELTEQNSQVNDLNVRIVGQAIQQAKEIQDLLRLTGGRAEPLKASTGSAGDVKDADFDHQAVNEFDNKQPSPNAETADASARPGDTSQH